MKVPASAVAQLVLACVASTPGQTAAQQGQPAGYSFTRIYEDSTGASHFADEELLLEAINPGRDIPPTPASVPIAASGMRVFCPSSGAEAGWHPVPFRLYNLILSGEIEIEVSDGETRRFGPGSLILGEDTGGQGHRTRIIGEARACFAMIQLLDG